MSSNPQKLHLHKRILHLLANSDNYRINQEYFHQQIKQRNYEVTINMIIVIQGMLRDDQYDPYSKFLALRFMKDAFCSASYAFITLVNSILMEILLDVGMFKKACKQDDRGQQLYLSYSRAVYNEKYLRTLGLSFHKMVLQMYECMWKIIQTCPYNDPAFGISSSFLTHYNSMKAVGVKFPDTPTYYKSKEVQRIKEAYNKQSSQKNVYLQEIDEFYKYFLCKCLINPDEEQVMKQILVKIIKSGDQYVVDHIIVFLKTILITEAELKLKNGSQHIDIIDIIHRMIKSADIEAILKIQANLLLPILQLYVNNQLTQEQINKIGLWSLLMGSINQKYGQYYLQMAKMIKTQYTKDQIEQEIKKFNSSWQLLKYNNQSKLNSLKIKNPHKEQIVKILDTIQQPKIPSSIKQISPQPPVNDDIISVSIPQEEYYFDNSIITPSSKQSFRIPKTQYKYRKPSRNILDSNIMKYKIRSLNMNLRTNQQYNYHSQSTQSEKLREPKMLQGKRKGFRDQSNKCISEDESRSVSKYNAESLSNSKQTFYDQYFNIKLENQVQRRIEKQKQLERQLKEKDQLIEKLTKTESMNLNPTKSTYLKKPDSLPLTNYRNINLDNVAECSEIQSYRSHTKLSLASPRKQTNATYKVKREILKRRSLIIKNAYLQIGMITKPNKNTLECSFFCTPFTNLDTITLKIICPAWINTYDKQVEHRYKANAQIQFVMKFQLAFNIHQEEKSYFNKPVLSISYTKENETFENKIDLSILINKFIENMPVKDTECRNIIGRYEELSAVIKLDQKICKNFDDFIKYFPNATILDDPKTFIAFLEVIDRINFYLYLKIMSKEEIILKIIPTKKQYSKLQVLKIIFKTYCFLFSS